MLMAARDAFTAGGDEPQYDWLESDGVAYVQLPINCGSDLDFEFALTLISGGNNYGYLFGGYNGWGQTNPPTRYSCYCGFGQIRQSGSRLDIGAGQPTSAAEIGAQPYGYATERLVGSFSQDSGIASVNGTENLIPSGTKADVSYAVGTMPMGLLCGCSYANIGYRPLKCRLYSFKIKTTGGTLLFDFEPRVIDGEVVVFDKVSQTALETLGGGTFTAGRDNA